MVALPYFSIRHPIMVLAAASVLVLLAVPGIRHLQLRTDGHALIPTDAEEIRIDREIRTEFFSEDPIVVVVKTDDANGIYNRHTLKLVSQLTARLGRLAGVRPVDLFSLATEHGHRVWPGTLNVRRLLDPLPQTPDELHRLRDDVRAIGLYSGTLVSLDESATAIMVGVPAKADRPAFFRSVQTAVAAAETVGGADGETFSIIGAPVAEVLLGTHLLEDLGVPNEWLGRYAHQSRAGPSAVEPAGIHGLMILLGRKVGLVPIALALMGLVFLLSFRSAVATLLPLSEVGACLLAVFGVMGYTGVPFYLTFAVLPVILTAIGVADEIHIFHRYAELLRADSVSGHRPLLHKTMADMCGPVTKTSLTTAVAFLSFSLSPLEPVRMFGLFTAGGVLFCWLWSLSVIPALLSLLGRGRFGVSVGRAGVEKRPRLSQLFGGLAAFILRRRVATVFLAGLVLAMTPFGIGRLRIQDSWINGFAADSEFRRATDEFNQSFLGMHMLTIVVDAGHEVLTGTLPASSVEHRDVCLPAEIIQDAKRLVGRRIRMKRLGEVRPSRRGRRVSPRADEWDAWIKSARLEGGLIRVTAARRDGSPRLALRLDDEDTVSFRIVEQPMMNPDVLALIAKLDAFIEARSQDAVGGVLSTADYLSTANFMARGLNPEHRIIPPVQEKIEWVWSQYKRIRGEDRLRQIVDRSFSRALVTVFLKDANFVATGRLMRAIRQFESEHFAPEGIHLEFAGDVAVSQTLIDAIVSTQIRSVGLSFGAIFLMTALLGRSLVWGLLCVVPCALTVLINFAVMGLVGMPLGVATSMFASMTLGIGVDYAIHLLERYRRVLPTCADAGSAIVAAIRETGPAVSIDALAVALGFGILCFSQVPANARLGGLVVLSIAGCFFATVCLLPALLGLGAWREAVPARNGAGRAQ